MRHVKVVLRKFMRFRLDLRILNFIYVAHLSFFQSFFILSFLVLIL